MKRLLSGPFGDAVLFVVAAALAAVLTAALIGCSSGDRPPGGTPRAWALTAADAGGVVAVAAGDVVRVSLPCEGDACYRLTGGGIPHLVLEEQEDDGVWRFRAAAPGRCRLRFAGRRAVEFEFSVR